MFPLIEQLQELIKSYYVFKPFDAAKTAELRKKIDEIRLAIALDADLRNIFFQQLNVPANASGYKQDVFFTQGDTRFSVKRGLADLLQTVTISLLHQGKRQNVITRENLAWQQLFADIQNGATQFGQQTLFDFVQELFFEQNETLNIGVTGQTSAGNIFLQGCNFKDDYTPDVANIKAEIAESLPAWQIVPLVFKFASNVAGTDATGVDGNDEIYSTKSDKSVVLTHVAISSQDMRLTLFDEGRSQTLCEKVEACGIASDQSNPYTSYYPLPYPHLLRRQDRLKLRAINGSLITGNEVAANDIQYLSFAGYTV